MLKCNSFILRSDIRHLFTTGSITIVKLAIVSDSCCVIGVFIPLAFGCTKSSYTLERDYNLGEATFRTFCVITFKTFKIAYLQS